MAPRNFFTKKKLFYGSGLLATMFGALYVYFPDVVEMGVRSQVNIQEGNQIYPNWIKFPVAVETRFTFFEVENPEDALRGAKVRVHERGPYCFKQYRRKKIIWFSEDKRRVKYYEYKVYQEDNQSEGCQRNWDEKFSVINAPVAALGGTIGDLVLDKIPLPGVTSPVIFGTVNTFLASHRQNLFMKRSPREIVLGYKVNLLETITSLVKPLEALGIKGLLPENGPKDNVFGLLYGRNNTPEGPYEMWTGVGDSTRNYSMFISWKDSRKLKFWGGDRCNRVLGGDGTGFPPFLTKNDRIYVFNPDACRAIPFDYIKDNEFKGIPVLRFGISEEFFNSPDRDPMNECFCMHKKRRYRCQQNGAYDLGGCQAGAPILLTKPHFLNTDPDLSQLVEGLSPNPELHEGFLEVEPFTGGGVNAMGKLQFGLRVEKIPFLRGFNSIRNAVIPLVWIQEGAGLPDNLADQLRNQLISPVKGASIGIAGIAGTSLVLFVIIGLMILMGKNEQTGKNNEKKEKSGNEKSQDQKPATIEPKIDSYQSPPPSMMAQDFSQSNGLLPIMGQFNQRRAIASLPFQANNTNAIQPMMRARWDGLLLHPGQYNFGFNGNLGMINGAQPAIFVPISPDIMVDYQSSRGTQLHRLSAVSDGYQSDTESLPPLENMPRSSLRSRSAGDGIKRESRSSSTSPRPNSLPNANRSLESRYFNDTVPLIEFR